MADFDLSKIQGAYGFTQEQIEFLRAAASSEPRAVKFEEASYLSQPASRLPEALSESSLTNSSLPQAPAAKISLVNTSAVQIMSSSPSLAPLNVAKKGKPPKPLSAKQVIFTTRKSVK